jgi:hypothetical protein
MLTDLRVLSPAIYEKWNAVCLHVRMDVRLRNA